MKRTLTGTILCLVLCLAVPLPGSPAASAFLQAVDNNTLYTILGQ